MRVPFICVLRMWLKRGLEHLVLDLDGMKIAPADRVMITLATLVAELTNKIHSYGCEFPICAQARR